jgi:hypothetical protein
MSLFALVVESKSTPSFRHGLAEPLDRVSEPGHKDVKAQRHPWLLDPGNPCRGDAYY